LSPANFDQWVEATKASGNLLGRTEYLKLEKPSVAEPVRRFASVDAGLYQAILNRCVDSSKMCMDQMMSIDATGGSGKGGIDGLSAKPWRDTQRTFVAALCTPANPYGNTLLAESSQP
jgi:cytochrome o ubiquinol oxidase subunit 2